MLEYGFSRYQLYSPVNTGDALGFSVPVRLGGSDQVAVVSGGTCSVLLQKGEESGISVEAALVERVNAPVYKGDVLGEIRLMQSGRTVARVPAVAGETVELPGMVHALVRIRDRFMISR